MLLIIVALQNDTQIQKVQAQDIGLGDVIFEETTTETQVNSFFMDELGYIAIKLHLILAQKDIEIVSYEGDVLTTIKKLEELTKTDIIELLNLSTNKEEALARYLSDTNRELQKWDIISTYIRQEMGILKWDMESCLIEKDISDRAYFDAIERYDQDIMETSLEDSIRYENCVATNRIQYNAKIWILNKLIFYLGLLQKKYDVLFVKQDIVTQNFKIFRDNILSDLEQIDTLLQQYTF